MSFFKNAACWLGLVDQGWVRVRGPGVEAVITGEKAEVQRLMYVVQEELIRIVKEGRGPLRSRTRRCSSTVMPTEFDERDSPDVLSGRVTGPHPRSASRARRLAAQARSTRENGALRSLGKSVNVVTADSETEQVHLGVLLEITEQ